MFTVEQLIWLVEPDMDKYIKVIIMSDDFILGQSYSGLFNTQAQIKYLIFDHVS